MQIAYTRCPHCNELVYMKNCANCAHYYAHYIPDERTGGFVEVHMGHCKHKRNGTRPDKAACDHWEGKEP